MNASARPDDEEIRQELAEYAKTRDATLREDLIRRHHWIAVQCARRFAGRGEPLDDLVQVASIGLVKALDRFDPSVGAPFPSYALPTVTGELRRHFRDTTWAVHVPRRLKELSARLHLTDEHLTTVLGRSPSTDELARELGVSTDEVLDALEASAAYRTRAITSPYDDEPDSGIGASGEDRELEQVEVRMLVDRLLEGVSERERVVLRLRFVEEKSQQEIASVIGTSQAHVSRLIRAALDRLRAYAAEQEG